MTRKKPNTRRSLRGFTLVELMVAITGGLFISLSLFAIARESGRFYNRESRISDATLGSLLGFERLKADISRAGFLGTPNVKQDPHLCGDPVADGTWPALNKRLAAIRITRRGSPANGTLNNAVNNLFPDSILLMGSYTGSEEFPIWNVQDNGATYTIYLQQNTGPLARLGYATAIDKLTLLQSVFGAGRALRIQDQSGEIQFGTIVSVGAGAQPQIVLSQQPKLRFRQDAGTLCGLKGNVTGATVNVVNFVQYDLRNPNTNSNYGGQNVAFAPVYGSGGAPFDTDRTDLVRVELDTSGTAIQGTEEIVSEYAVDLKFGITAVNQYTAGTDPTFTQTLLPDDAAIPGWAGDLVTDVTNPTQGPQRLRSVRVRFSVRSQEADRDSRPVTTGLYRVALGVNGAAPFARVRTVQADVNLPNQTGVFY